MNNIRCTNPECQKEETEYSLKLIANEQGELKLYKPIYCKCCGSEMEFIRPVFSEKLITGVGVNKFKGMNSDLKKEMLHKRASADYNRYHKKAAQQRKSEMIKQIKDSIESPNYDQ